MRRPSLSLIGSWRSWSVTRPAWARLFSTARSCPRLTLNATIATSWGAIALRAACISDRILRFVRRREWRATALPSGVWCS